MIFVLLSSLITIFFPILSLIYNLFCFIFIKNYRKLFAILLSISISSIAYVWNPAENYDLYHWHLEMLKFSNNNFKYLIETIKNNFEPLNYFLKYIFSKTGNFNLIQAFVSFFGYFEILWIIQDYSKKKNISIFSVSLVTGFILSTIQFVNFISGLWFIFAIINFSTGIYLEYFCNNKKLALIFIVITPLIHISTIYVILVYILAHIKSDKKIKSFLLVVLICSMFVGNIIVFIDKMINNNIVHYIRHLYDTYFLQGSQYDYLHSGKNFIFSMFRLVFVLLSVYIVEKKTNVKLNRKYLLIVSIFCVSTLVIIFSSKIYIRYAILVSIIGIPILLELFNKKITKNLSLMIMFYIIILLYYIPIQYIGIKAAKIPEQVYSNINKNIFSLENGGIHE